MPTRDEGSQAAQRVDQTGAPLRHEAPKSVAAGLLLTCLYRCFKNESWINGFDLHNPQRFLSGWSSVNPLPSTVLLFYFLYNKDTSCCSDSESLNFISKMMLKAIERSKFLEKVIF